MKYNNNYTYNTVNPVSNSFAPTSANNGYINFEFGINGSMRKRIDTNKSGGMREGEAQVTNLRQRGTVWSAFYEAGKRW